MVTRDELAPLLLAATSAFVEGEKDPDWARRVAELDAERCLTIAALTNGPRSVLEIGVGYGLLTTTLRAVFGESIGVSAVEHPARRYVDDPRYRARLVEQRVDLQLCDIAADPIPFTGAAFDAVLFCDVIEHLPPTRVAAVIEQLRDRLSPSGRIVMSSTNLSAFGRIASLAFGSGMIQDPPLPHDYAGGTYGHIRLYGHADIQALSAHAGMRIVEWRYLNWERIFFERKTLAGKLVYGGQLLAPKVRPRMSTSWACALIPAGHD